MTGVLTAVSAVTFLLLPSPTPPSSSNDTAAAAAPADRDPPATADDDSITAALLPASAEADQNSSSSSSSRTQHPVQQHSNTQSLWSNSNLILLLAVIAVFNFLNVGTEVAFGGWIFTYSTKQAGLSPHEGHYLNASYWLAFTLGRVIASFAAVYVKPQTLLLTSLPLAALGAAAALVGSTASSAGWLLLLVVTVLVGLGASAGFANALALLDSYHPCTGSITGLLGGVAGAGCMTVPLVIALLAKHTVLQYQGLMWCTLVSFVIQLVCVPIALVAGSRVLQSRENWSDVQSVTKELLVGEQPEESCNGHQC